MLWLIGGHGPHGQTTSLLHPCYVNTLPLFAAHEPVAKLADFPYLLLCEGQRPYRAWS